MKERVLPLLRRAELVLLEEDVDDSLRRAIEVREVSRNAIFAAARLDAERAEAVQQSMKIGVFDHSGTVYFICNSEKVRASFLKKVPSARIATSDEMQLAVLQQHMCRLVEEHAAAHTL
jgi:hypothetical protein